MLHVGLDSVRYCLENNIPVLWKGEVITTAEAQRLLASTSPAVALREIIEPTLPPKPTDHVIRARVAACRACAYYRAGSDTCTICGCGSIVAQRAASPLGACPNRLWPG